jgi:hypothetical protein
MALSSRLLTFGLLAIGSCGGTASDVDNSNNAGAGVAYETGLIFVRQVQAPDWGQCSYSSDPMATSRLRGKLDLMLTTRYQAALLVGSLPVHTDAGALAAVTLQRVEVVVVTAAGTVLFTSSEPASGFVPPAHGDVPGWGLTLVDLIGGANGAGLGAALGLPTTRSDEYATVTANIKVKGTTLEGRPVVAENFSFPIDVCSGCLLTFPVAANISGMPEPNCMNLSESDYDTPCLFGQDDWVDCRLCHVRLGSSDPCQP